MPTERGIARVHQCDWNGEPARAAGLAFAVNRYHLITCAHVVNVALGRELRDPSQPEQSVVLLLVFPFGAAEYGTARLAAIARWIPEPGRDIGSQDDLAVLELTEELPVGVPTLSFVPAPYRGPVTLCGPRQDLLHQVLVTGVLVGESAQQQVQVDLTRSKMSRVKPGFSGSPVWRSDETVAGMLRALPGEEGARYLHVIGAERLAAVCDNLAVPAGPLRPPAETPSPAAEAPNPGTVPKPGRNPGPAPTALIQLRGWLAHIRLDRAWPGLVALLIGAVGTAIIWPRTGSFLMGLLFGSLAGLLSGMVAWLTRR
jgi:Trypsin-like peptidase domain